MAPQPAAFRPWFFAAVFVVAVLNAFLRHAVRWPDPHRVNAVQAAVWSVLIGWSWYAMPLPRHGVAYRLQSRLSRVGFAVLAASVSGLVIFGAFTLIDRYVR